MKDYTVRVDSVRESWDDPKVVSVGFTGKPKPKKEKKKKNGGECATPCPMGEFPNFSVPMTPEEAAKYPIGHRCKISLEPLGADDDEGDENEKPDMTERMTKRVKEQRKYAD